ncbi:DNA replication protein DnaD [Bacillus sp. V3-13]|uniref:DnaD domain-containing protein n=1 Tax=Bacillus sp. V3-13 TaxID=2053728 RepID=UPI000C777526|nr:DnaD domain-containing protein [Bacillus sp. V3-13]PLR77172.1 DNA replication protein DnaD [Bacillus sp. V3-13]
MRANILSWLEEGLVSIPGVLLTHYKKLNMNEQELALLLHIISFSMKGNEFPTPAELSARMTITATECAGMLRRLIQKGFLSIMDGHSPEGIMYEKYSLQPLWEKLVDQFLLDTKGKQADQQQKDEMDLYTCFEREFGRPLSPFECESLAMWMDDDLHDPIIIKAALREAVISGKLNFRYIDRILFEWKKNGIRTIEQARSHSRKFRQHQNHQRENQDDLPANVKTIPFYNWLEQ